MRGFRQFFVAKFPRAISGRWQSIDAAEARYKKILAHSETSGIPIADGTNIIHDLFYEVVNTKWVTVHKPEAIPIADRDNEPVPIPVRGAEPAEAKAEELAEPSEGSGEGSAPGESGAESAGNSPVPALAHAMSAEVV